MKKWKKNILILFFTVSAILSFAVLYSNYAVKRAASDKTFNSLSDVPYRQTGILLGTSKMVKNGKPNLYFRNRIEAAANLLKAGKIRYLIISGDNGSIYYDEPTDMRKALIQNGIDSTRLFLDYAGFRTFDSMVRVKEVFGQKEVMVISQKFHNERAIYIASRIGINAIGFNARDVQKYYGFKTFLRERLARVKVMLDFLTGAEPRYLGKKVEVK